MSSQRSENSDLKNSFFRPLKSETSQKSIYINLAIDKGETERSKERKKRKKEREYRVHSNLDLGAVNVGVYLELVADSLLTEFLLIKNSKFKRFGQFQKPWFSSWKFAKSSNFELFGVEFLIEIVIYNQTQIGNLEFQSQKRQNVCFFSHLRNIST